MVNVYKGKGDALTCGSYRGTKLLEYAMKEKGIKGRARRLKKLTMLCSLNLQGKARWMLVSQFVSCRRNMRQRRKIYG